MRSVSTREQLREAVARWRGEGQRIALVPTMGNLHDGHFGLVGLARMHADRVVASVFVNPTQFGPGEDFERYPRTPGADADGLAAHGCDLMFAPEVADLYPFGAKAAVQMRVPGLSEVLCGASRPGHFDGVATVVARLFALSGPDVAVFGEKDYQQLQLIRRLVADLGFALQIVAAPTRREPDGLAMSSRNRYLDAGQRRRAPAIHRCLQAMRAGFLDGEPPEAVAATAAARLADQGFEVDYAELRRGEDLSPARPGDAPSALRAFVAARLGGTRLIDNLALG